MVLFLLVALAVGGGFPLVAAGVALVWAAVHMTWLTVSARRSEAREG